MHNVTINVEKTTLCAREVEFVGHRVSSDGVRPLSSSIEAVAGLPPPHDASELRRFLGAANFYRKFVRDFSARAEPLTEFLRQNRLFEWGEPQQRACEDLRNALTSTPTLAHFDD